MGLNLFFFFFARCTVHFSQTGDYVHSAYSISETQSMFAPGCQIVITLLMTQEKMFASR